MSLVFFLNQISLLQQTEKMYIILPLLCEKQIHTQGNNLKLFICSSMHLFLPENDFSIIYDKGDDYDFTLKCHKSESYFISIF